jgi:hypothetical protein
MGGSSDGEKSDQSIGTHSTLAEEPFQSSGQLAGLDEKRQTIFVKAEQPWKTLLPMLVTSGPIVMLVRLEQLLKA